MTLYLFRSSGRVFGVTGEETGSNLPSGVGDWTFFKTLALERGTPTPGLNVDECLDDVERYGFHITDAHVRITERFVSAARA